MTGDGVLAPLAVRYPGVRAGVIPPDADGPVRAMPVVLRIERGPAPRTAVLEAAAAAALAVCLDPRSAPGGEWHEAVSLWIGGRIRKIVRRARGAHWAAVQGLPGVTCAVGPGPGTGGTADTGDMTVGVAEVRALLPGPVDEVPRIVSRLQIGGTDLEPDDPGPPPDGAVAIWLNPAVPMTVGKAAAQVGHASMLVAAVRRLTIVPRFAVRVAPPRRWAGCAQPSRVRRRWRCATPGSPRSPPARSPVSQPADGAGCPRHAAG